ncbi:hypothetical protein [Myxococcus sp. RHSTA-1-4]|uniref:hypothetical protein n=1 Tax=Myxococcus sp. RHSTA-1-4 TaxID=2874601 RepID=UPI001CC14051|nr:hypothetical protein [Myxococcus sp. RHSTA-1-4]MBZ4415029.1 hypothetical protein [Myxococcus sp. RHSTA-1-4]
MAEIVEKERPGVVPAVAGVPFRLSWSAILGGTFVALGVWILLYSLGLALGLSAMDPADPGSARSAGIGTGIWSLVAPLIALFVGGFVAARTAGVLDKGGGALHGAVLWGLTTLLGTILMGMALTSLIGTVFRTTGAVVGAAGQAVVGAASQGGEAAQAFGLDADDALAPINQRLSQEGKPAITADQFQAATRDVINTAIRTGKLDRNLLVTSIAENTNLSRQDADEVATRVEQQFNQRRAQLGEQAGQLGQQVQQGALKAADTTGRVFWGIFGALLLGLVSAVLGATLGVSRRQRVYAEGAVTPGPRREVYP